MTLLRIPTALLPDPKVRRWVLKLTQSEVAEAAVCGRRTVIRAEKSGAYPRFAGVRQRYLRALGIIEKR